MILDDGGVTQELPEQVSVEEITSEKNEKRGKAYWFSSILLALMFALCIIFAAQVMSKGYVDINGYSFFRVVTGSMEPTIPCGAVLINKETPISEIKVDDIICYRSGIAEIYGAIVTHRVVGIERDVAGKIYLETRGDANNSSDPYYADETNLVGKVIWHKDKVGFLTGVLAFLSGDIGFLACIVFPVLLISGMIMQRAVNSLKREMQLARQLENMSPKEDTLVQGYQTVTKEEYDLIFEKIKEELLEEYSKKQ